MTSPSWPSSLKPPSAKAGQTTSVLFDVEFANHTVPTSDTAASPINVDAQVHRMPDQAPCSRP